jgi:hypothetical protein
MQEGISWSVDAEVSGDFDSIDRTRLREVLRPRVNGGVRSPVLANVFRQHGSDECFERDVRLRLKRRGFLFRLADAFCIGCEREADARKIMAVLPQRFARLD